MPPDKVPAYKPLPPLGSDERKKMIADLATAFGDWNKDSPGAVDPAAVYDQLSQLSYHDRITLCYQVFRQQGVPDNGGLYEGDAEKYVRGYLLPRLMTGADNKQTFAGANRFLHLMSDAPQDAYHQKLLNINLNYIKRQTFSDKDNADVVQPLGLLMAYNAEWDNNDPNKLLVLIGIKPGAPPFRSTNPLTEVDAPKYTPLPAPGTQERAKLVADLVKAMGKTSPFKPGLPRIGYDGPTDPQIGKGFKGFEDPEAVLQLLGQFDYNSRLELYRQVLVARGD